MRFSRVASASLAALALICAGCQGVLGDVPSPEAGPDFDEGGRGEPASDGFSPGDGQPQLLPFWVRLSRVAAVVGLPAEDAVFELLRHNRLDLGDYDYANGIQPNRMWSPARMALWVKSLRPVCESQAMRERYPALPEDLPALIEAAYGREATDEDLAAANESIAGAPEENRYTLLCLATLSAMKFVIQ